MKPKNLGRINTLPFEFREPWIGEASSLFVIRVPANMRSKDQLMGFFASAGRFPDYFGATWDSLVDCLRDLEWIEEEKVLIEHLDLPLFSHPRESRIYLEILRDVVNDWANASHEPHESAKPSSRHSVQVAFPPALRTVIANILGS